MSSDSLDLKVVALDRVFPRVAKQSLVQWAMEGRIAPGDLVRGSEADRWIPVTSVPWLAASLPAGVHLQSADAADIEAEADVDAAANWVATRKKRKYEEAEMDMTPMIDVTFQLLIFFMLTNQLANPAPLAVPEAVYGRGVSPEGKQYILIDDKGGYYLGEKALPENLAASLDGLVEEVGRNAGQSSDPLDVIVTAHKASRHAQVRELVQRLGTISNLGGVMLGVEEKRQ